VSKRGGRYRSKRGPVIFILLDVYLDLSPRRKAFFDAVFLGAHCDLNSGAAVSSTEQGGGAIMMHPCRSAHKIRGYFFYVPGQRIASPWRSSEPHALPNEFMCLVLLDLHASQVVYLNATIWPDGVE